MWVGVQHVMRTHRTALDAYRHDGTFALPMRPHRSRRQPASQKRHKSMLSLGSFASCSADELGSNHPNIQIHQLHARPPPPITGHIIRAQSYEDIWRTLNLNSGIDGIQMKLKRPRSRTAYQARIIAPLLQQQQQHCCCRARVPHIHLN